VVPAKNATRFFGYTTQTQRGSLDNSLLSCYTASCPLRRSQATRRRQRR